MFSDEKKSIHAPLPRLHTSARLFHRALGGCRADQGDEMACGIGLVRLARSGIASARPHGPGLPVLSTHGLRAQGKAEEGSSVGGARVVGHRFFEHSAVGPSGGARTAALHGGIFNGQTLRRAWRRIAAP